MMVTSPGLDELTGLLIKLRGREDAITRELERRRADVEAEIAVVEEAIRLLAAEHGGAPEPAVSVGTSATSHSVTTAPVVDTSAQTAQDAPRAAQDTLTVDVGPEGTLNRPGFDGAGGVP